MTAPTNSAADREAVALRLDMIGSLEDDDAATLTEAAALLRATPSAEAETTQDTRRVALETCRRDYEVMHQFFLHEEARSSGLAEALSKLIAAARPFALYVKNDLPDEYVIDCVSWCVGDHRRLLTAMSNALDLTLFPADKP